MTYEHSKGLVCSILAKDDYEEEIISSSMNRFRIKPTRSIALETEKDQSKSIDMLD